MPKQNDIPGHRRHLRAESGMPVVTRMRPRACAAIIRNDAILMVRHHDGRREYWTLPGGGLKPGETPEQAALREVWEETRLHARIARFLYQESYRFGISTCFLAEVDDACEPALGEDPEEAHLPPAERVLKAAAWRSIIEMREDRQVCKVLEVLAREVPVIEEV